MFPVPRLLAGSDAVPAADEPLDMDPAMWTPTPSARDALARPDETAAALTVLDPEPGPLAALNPRRLSDAGLVDALVASEKLAAALSAKQQEFLAEIARRDPEGDEFRPTRSGVR